MTMKAAIEKIEMVSGEMVDAQWQRHLATSGNVSVDLYRTTGGRLVVCTSPENDGRAVPAVDPDANPGDYGVSED